MNLKRTILVCLTTIFCLMTAAKVQAQDQRFRVGLKFSGNLSWISPDTRTLEKNGTGVGMSYGLMADYNFQRYYSLSTELIFTHFAGGINYKSMLQYTDTSGSTRSFNNIKYDYKLRYIQIPISLKFRTKEMGYITYWAQFGLAPSFLMEARADITGNHPFDDPTEIRVNKEEGDIYHFDNFNDKVFFMRMPLIIGAGIEYNIAGNTSLYTGLRLDNNFLTMFNADENASAKNHYVGLNVGVFF